MSRIRRRKPAAERKEIVLRVLVTAAQRKVMETAAARAGLALTTWLRAVGLREAQTPGEGKA